MSAAPDWPDHGIEVSGVDPADALQVMAVGADERDRSAWLAMRRTGIGGSDTSALVGLHQYKASIEVWEEKTGRTPLLADDVSEEGHWGTLLEPVVREEYSHRTGLRIRRVGMLRSQRWPHLLCDPDGLIAGAREGYEGKTASAFSRKWSDGEVDDHAELQAQHCMAVTGLSRWHVACLLGGQKLVSRIVERDDELISQLLDMTQRFWHEHVLADVPPPADDTSACGAWLDRTYPADDGGYVEIDPAEAAELLAEHAAVEAAVKAAEARKTHLSNRVKELLGSAERLLAGGREIATWRTADRFAEARFRKAHPGPARRYTRRRLASYFDAAALRATDPDLYREFCSRPLNWRS
jgi:putative phage-type endonuclease